MRKAEPKEEFWVLVPILIALILQLLVSSCNDEVMLQFVNETVFGHWQFFAVVVVFGVLNHFMSKKVFTRERAYAEYEKTKRKYFWFWGREALPILPLIVTYLLGLVWKDPEGQGWTRNESGWYFASAGALSLFLWVVIKGIAKQKGLQLTFPGESERPPPA